MQKKKDIFIFCIQLFFKVSRFRSKHDIIIEIIILLNTNYIIINE